MSPHDHRTKAERIEQSLIKLTPDDWEIQIEAAMLAGTHWVNYVLHQTGITTPAEDMIHASMSMVCMLRKYKLAEPALIDDLEVIEDLRPLYVRGDVEGGAAAAQQALRKLDAIRERALALSA